MGARPVRQFRSWSSCIAFLGENCRAGGEQFGDTLLAALTVSAKPPPRPLLT